MRRVAIGVVVALSLAVVVQSALAATPRQSKQAAERNLLSATHVIARWRVGLVDPKSGLVRQNTTAVCRGVGAHTLRGYSSFRCVLRHGSTVVRVRYMVLRRNGFELHRLRAHG